MSAPPAQPAPRFLMDKNVEPAIIGGVRLKRPQADLLSAVEAGTLGMLDPQLLAFAADHDRILVTHDQRTMLGHFATFLMSGRHSPGVMMLPDRLSIGESIGALLLILDASLHGEWQDRLIQVPL